MPFPSSKPRTDSGPTAPPLSLVMALRRLLRPLLSFGVQYPYLANLLKLTYVEVATREFPLEDRPHSDSRISLLTGIHRQDVKRLRGGDNERRATPAGDFAGCAPGFALAR